MIKDARNTRQLLLTLFFDTKEIFTIVANCVNS